VLTANRTNWLVEPPLTPRACTIKIRYNATPAAGEVVALEGGRLQATFTQPQHGVAPGQAVVCFDGERLLGGGWIE
jgi:tRNA-specific 2-thiouridylase